jgi:hypothetical protein
MIITDGEDHAPQTASFKGSFDERGNKVR